MLYYSFMGIKPMKCEACADIGGRTRHSIQEHLRQMWLYLGVGLRSFLQNAAFVQSVLP
jgi:hypothetical protein